MRSRARSVGRAPGGRRRRDPVDVFLPRYRIVPDLPAGSRATTVRVPDPRAPAGHSDVSVIDVAADGYRLRLVDHPAAFDREGLYGDAAGDYADNAWRFGLFCRAALRGAPRRRPAGRRPAPPRLAYRPGRALPRRALRRRPDHRQGGDPPDDPQPRLPRLDAAGALSVSSGCGRATGSSRRTPRGIDLLRVGIERAELVNTVSPGFAAEALTPAFGMGLDGDLRAKGDRFFGILNGLDTGLWDPATDADTRRAVLARRPARARPPAGRTC